MSTRRDLPTLNKVLELALKLTPADQARLAQRLIEQLVPALEQLKPPEQLPLFEEPAVAPPVKAVPQTEPAASTTPVVPLWTFAPGYDHTDLIADESAIVYLFSVDALSAIDRFYTRPIYRQLLQALKAFGQHERNRIRNQAFTLFAGDIIGAAVPGVEGEVFGLAVDSDAESIATPLERALSKVTGFCGTDTGSTISQFVPRFRYDQGYVIEYSDPEIEGTTYVDGPDNYGSGLTIYRRIWLPAEDVGRRKSNYGKLRRS